MAYQNLLYKPLIDHLKQIEDLFSMDLYQISKLISVTDEKVAGTIKLTDKEVRSIATIVREFRIDLKPIVRTRAATLKLNQTHLNQIHATLDRSVAYITTVKKFLEVTLEHMKKSLKEIHDILLVHGLTEFVKLEVAPIATLIAKMNTILNNHKEVKQFVTDTWGKKKSTVKI
jgi:hypothetical protein